jgi:hypothetical protein
MIKYCVFFEVRTEFLNVIYASFCFKSLKVISVSTVNVFDSLHKYGTLVPCDVVNLTWANAITYFIGIRSIFPRSKRGLIFRRRKERNDVCKLLLCQFTVITNTLFYI